MTQIPPSAPLPSYDRYTLEQLQRARRSIDVERFPERTALLDQLIVERQQQPTAAPEALAAPHIRPLAYSQLRGSPWLRRCIGAITIWGALSGVVNLILMAPPSSGFLSFLIGLVLVAACGWSCWAGVLLMEDRPGAVHHNQTVWAFQILAISSPWLNYSLANAGIASIWVRLDEFTVVFKLFLGTQLDLRFNTPSEPIVFGVNFLAIAVIGLLVALEDSSSAVAATAPSTVPSDSNALETS